MPAGVRTRGPARRSTARRCRAPSRAACCLPRSGRLAGGRAAGRRGTRPRTRGRAATSATAGDPPRASPTAPRHTPTPTTPIASGAKTAAREQVHRERVREEDADERDEALVRDRRGDAGPEGDEQPDGKHGRACPRARRAASRDPDGRSAACPTTSRRAVGARRGSCAVRPVPPIRHRRTDVGVHLPCSKHGVARQVHERREREQPPAEGENRARALRRRRRRRTAARLRAETRTRATPSRR